MENLVEKPVDNVEIVGEENQRIYLDDEGRAYVHTRNGRFIISPEYDNSDDGLYVTFQPYTRYDDVIPLEQNIAHVQNITSKNDSYPRIRVSVWGETRLDIPTFDNSHIFIKDAVMKSAEKE